MAELGVFGIGVATADPELREVGDKKTAVCTVNLAFNRSYQDKDKEWQSEPCFLRAQVWGARAKRMSELVKKGQPIYVCGYMKQDTWEKDGQKRVSYSITLRDFQLCQKNGKKKASEPQPAGTTSAPAESQPGDDQDIPF
jgi:single-strand DNA-binding protein